MEPAFRAGGGGGGLASQEGRGGRVTVRISLRVLVVQAVAVSRLGARLAPEATLAFARAIKTSVTPAWAVPEPREAKAALGTGAKMVDARIDTTD